VLRAAFRDLRARGVRRVLVTGDLTHVSLPQEFRAARGHLAELGEPEAVFLVPGNHDCYVPVPAAESWDEWAAYLRGQSRDTLAPALAACVVDPPARDRAPRHADYPTLRVEGRLAVVGLCSAVPTPIFRAGGRLGSAQLERLERLLVELGRIGLCRVVLVHHPVIEAMEPPRRRLEDGAALRSVLERAGASLVLHGHKHRRRVGFLAGPDGPIPVIGVPSSSEVGSRPEKRARYHVYTVEERKGDDAGSPSGRFRIAAEVRGYDAASGEFVAVDEPLVMHPAP